MSWLREAANKLRHLFGRSRFDNSLGEEMRLHLEARADELIAAGMPAQDAMAAARREFGPAARLAEESRDAWRWRWAEDLLQDLRYAARALARDRGFAATAVVSLALGIGVNTTIFSLAAEFLFSRPTLRDPDTLVRAMIGGNSHAPMREYRFIRDAKVFDGLAGANEMQEINWRSGERSERLFATFVTDNYFEVTGTPVALGRPIAVGERDGVVVISHRFWRSRLNGDAGIVGQALTLDGKAYTVVGVLPAVHRTVVGFGYSPEIYIPVPGETTRVAFYGRLPRGETRGAALERLKAAAARLDQVYPDGNHKWANDVSLTSLVGIERLNDRVSRTTATFFAMLMAAVGLLLVIACTNIASLLLARAATRAHEFAIRMSIGANRGRVIRQLLTESLLLAVLGASAGLALNYALTRFLNGVTPPVPFPMHLSIEPDSRLLLYAAAIAVASALMAGLLPALKSTRAGTSALLKRDEHQVSGRRATLRSFLVAGQLAVSVLVLIMAALSIRNLMQSAALDPGFDLRRTVWAQARPVPESNPNPSQGRARVRTTIEKLSAVPGVSQVTAAALVPLNDHFASRSIMIFSDVSNDGTRVQLWWNAIGPDYLKTMGIGLVAGREFHALDREGSRRVVIVNEPFARRVFGRVNPVGREIRFGRDDQTGRIVVGVARVSKYSTLGEDDRPALFEPYLQVGSGRGMLNYLVRTSGPPESSVKALNAALLEIDPTAAVEVKPMSRATAFALYPSRLGAFLLGTIGGLGLLLAAVGLYGLFAYSISRRTREIGLRVALGARRSQVVRLILAEGAWTLLIGLAAGMAVAFFVTQPLARFLVPGLSPSDPLAYLAVAVVLAAVGCVASLTPVLRALRIDPMAALRHE